MPGKGKSACTRRREDLQTGRRRAVVALTGDCLKSLDGIFDKTGDDVNPVFAAKYRVNVYLRGIGLPVGGGIEPTDYSGSDYQGKEDSIQELAAGLKAEHLRPALQGWRLIEDAVVK